MINMKRSVKESEAKEYSVCDEEEYPWGLQIRLSEEEISKLGIKDLPEAGATIIVKAKCKATEVGERDSVAGRKIRNLSLQITDMELSEEKSNDAVSKLYG